MSETHIYIYDQIGSGFFSEGIQAKSIAEQLNASKDKKVILHINSPGGSVYEGYAIYNLLQNSGKTIETVVEGICASIATLIALSGSKITMLPLSQWLVHNPFAFIEGDAEDLKKAADDLAKIQSTLVNIYVSKTGKTIEEIQALMNEDRIIDANEAMALGFVDEVKEHLKAVAFLKSNNSNSISMKDIEALETRMGVFEGLLNKFASLWKPKNIEVKTKDEKTLVIDPAVEAGATVTQDGAPAVDGDITLEDGKVITVMGGLITEVKDGEAAGAPDEVADLKAKIAELEAEKAANATALAAAQAEATSAKAAIAELRAEYENIMALTVGDNKPPKAGKQKFGPPAVSEWDEVINNARKS
jgi:ATP-dependent Clp endopeptidase proteolytic subunit ClpP